MNLYSITFWDGSTLIATAENIVAGNEQEAVRNGLRAIDHRRRSTKNWEQLATLQKHLEYPTIFPMPPDGVRVFAAEKPRGVKVIG